MNNNFNRYVPRELSKRADNSSRLDGFDVLDLAGSRGGSAGNRQMWAGLGFTSLLIFSGIAVIDGKLPK